MTKRYCKNTIRLYIWQLNKFPEYSTTLPTGTTPWKMWRRMCADKTEKYWPYMPSKDSKIWWVIGQYYPIENKKCIGIRWFNIQYLEGPQPISET